MLGFDSIGSAILIAYDGGPILTTDAWVNDNAYFGSWTHDYTIPSPQLDAIKRAKFHWFSHGHPDHLNVASLPTLSAGQFLLSDHYGKRIYRDLEALGHNVRILKDREWLALSDRIKVYSIANKNQDSILLIDVGGALIVNTNDSPDYGGSWHVRRIARHYKHVYYCALHGWGGADMLNLFTPDGRKLTDPREKHRPIAPRIQRGAMIHGANYGIPFSGFHKYQREDSAWANALIPELDDYLSDALPYGPRILPAFVRVNVEKDEICKIAPPRSALNVKKPEAFGDNWSDPMSADDTKKVDAYFRARHHLASQFGFIEVKLGGKSHTVDLNPAKSHRGITFEAPRASFMTCIENELFDDLLIGNFMKTTLHGIESLYPDFSPYTAKYADNGGAKSRADLSRYFLHYFLRDPLASILKMTSTESAHIVRTVVPENSFLFRHTKRVYYSLASRKRRP
jgi:hypothetical protein